MVPWASLGTVVKRKILSLLGNWLLFHNHLVIELSGCHDINMKTESDVSCLTMKENAAVPRKHYKITKSKKCEWHWWLLNLMWPWRSSISYAQSHTYACTHMYNYKIMVKCTLVQALRLCTGRTAHRGSRGIALPFHDHGTRKGWGVSVMPRPFFTPGKDLIPFIQEAGWAPGLVWTGVENLAPTGIRLLDRPARSQSLYRLHYLAHCTIIFVYFFMQVCLF